MLEAAFEGRFDEHDWDHAQGGVHVWLTDPAGIISHGSVLDRMLVCDGRRVEVAYVEAVATRAADRHGGHGSRVMERVGELIRASYRLGALSTHVYPFYQRLGWERWLGPTFVDGPKGRQRTPRDDGDIMILRTQTSPPLDLAGEIVCDWRSGDVW